MKKYEIYDTRFDGVFINKNKNEGFIIYWNSNVGFGRFAFVQNKETGNFEIDNELMSREFIKAVLNHFIDNAMLQSEREEDGD